MLFAKSPGSALPLIGLETHYHPQGCQLDAVDLFYFLEELQQSLAEWSETDSTIIRRLAGYRRASWLQKRPKYSVTPQVLSICYYAPEKKCRKWEEAVQTSRWTRENRRVAMETVSPLALGDPRI